MAAIGSGKTSVKARRRGPASRSKAPLSLPHVDPPDSGPGPITKRKRVLEEDEEPVPITPRSTKRRPTKGSVADGGHTVVDLTADSSSTHSTPRKRKAKDSPLEGKEERRLRIFRRQPPQSFVQKM